MIIYIEGNIGSGKTSLCNMLKSYNFECYTEPVQEWMLSGKLQDFYDGKISAYDFQSYIICSLHDREKNIIDDKNKIIIYERSILSSILFSNVLYKYKQINDLELKRIINLINTLYKKGHHIFLNTPAEGCLKRIEYRARPQEENINLDYLLDLEIEHKREFAGAYIIDGTKSKDEVYNQFIDILNKLKARKEIFGGK